VVATDAAGKSSDKAVSISVTDVNEDPVKTASAPTAPLIVVVDQPLQGASVAAWFSDPDGSATPFGKLTYSVNPALPTGLQLNRDTGAVTGTIGSMPDMQLTFTATDGTGRSVSHTVTAKTVSAPVITGFTVTDSVGSQTAGKAGDSLSFTVNLTEPVTVTGTPLLKFVTESGSEVSATYSASGSSGSALKFNATAPSGDGVLKLAAVNLNGGSITGDVSKQGLVVASVDQTFAGYRVDNTAPVVPSAGRTFGVNENSLAVGQIPATDATPVSFVLGSGGDAALFTLSPSGALAFQTAKDFEANPVARTFSISVVPTDAAGNAGASVPITINLQDQDESDVSVPLDSNSATNTVAENSSVGALVGAAVVGAAVGALVGAAVGAKVGVTVIP